MNIGMAPERSGAFFMPGKGKAEAVQACRIVENGVADLGEAGPEDSDQSERE